MFGEWLKKKRLEYMKKHVVTKEDFADLINYSSGHIRDIEYSLKNPPPEESLIQIARLFELKKEEIHEMFRLAYGSRLILERRKIKKIIESEYGPITTEEFNTAVYMFENNIGIVLRLYGGNLQDNAFSMLTSYIDRLREVVGVSRKLASVN